MNAKILKEIIETVLRKHPKDCIFTPNAAENIFNRALVYLEQGDNNDWVTILEVLIVAEEIYCPKEGVDKREECGIDVQR